MNTLIDYLLTSEEFYISIILIDEVILVSAIVALISNIIEDKTNG